MEKNEDILNKKDITEITDPILLISKIKGVKYKNKKTNKNSIGVIAQDIKNNIPEAFNNYNIDYTQLVALLIECIKNNNRNIKELQQEIKNLKMLLN